MKLNPFLILLAGVSLCLAADTPKTPSVGDSAPLIVGKDQNEKAWKLADEIGRKNVLLYFYPKDFTGGCTKEACGFRDSLTTLGSADVDVVGVSFDSSSSHTEFIKKYSLGFTLLADTDGKIADTYGVRMTGKDMARRVSFLINKDGKIAHVTDSSSADVQLAEMKAAVAKLNQK